MQIKTRGATVYPLEGLKLKYNSYLSVVECRPRTLITLPEYKIV